MTEHIQKSFDAVAESYRYRLSYHRQFFAELSDKLTLTRESKILDICCGNGQLSVGLADKISKSVAIDNSSGMLSLAPQHPRIAYLNHDINSPAFPPSLTNEQFDHFLIGRAIHFIRTDSLEDAVAKHLKAGGRIVVCGTEWSSNTSWFGEFDKVLTSYREGGERDYFSESKLAQIGFSIIDRLDIRHKVDCDLNFLLNHAMSYSRRGKKISTDFDNFKKQLADRMRPFLRDGVLSGEASSWALIYRSNMEIRNSLTSIRRELSRNVITGIRSIFERLSRWPQNQRKS
jgi:ubiquinone/menaquinone biosynthesis C-methylase UbiE